MTLMRRSLGMLLLILSMLGFAGCVVGIVRIWSFHQNAPEEAQLIAARVDAGFERASLTIQNVQRGLEQARASVDKVSKESAPISGSTTSNPRTVRAVRLLVRQQVEPSINNLGVQLNTLSDAAVAISSLLQTFRELPQGNTQHIDPDKLEGWANQASSLTTALRRLQGVVGDGNTTSSGQEIAAASSAVADALQRCQAKVDDWKTVLDSAQADYHQIKTQVGRWFTPAALVLTIVCAWMAVGQISLFVHAWQWCRTRESTPQIAS